ncbi:tetratricopeptide repeat protein [Sorangium sp. So ce136]|uniref:CHAT domain-containing tetratricopeptide repeat protein n=1 Tax=Sorangium sp. So ce136 TaxID=3133284 RepID=UPI003F0872BF
MDTPKEYYGADRAQKRDERNKVMWAGDALAHARRLDEEGKYAEAIDSATQVWSVLTDALGPEDARVAESMHVLATLYTKVGRYASAEGLLDSALALRKKSAHGDDKLVADMLSSMAVLYRERGRAPQAEALCDRALTMHEALVGSSSLEVARSLHLLASLHRDRGDYAAARFMCERALAIRERASAHETADLAESLDLLGRLYLDVGDHAGAEPVLERALGLHEQALGATHPELATTLSDLAELYRQRGEPARAEQLARRALAIRVRSLGPAHPAVAASSGQLGSLYRDRGNFVRAEQLTRRALEVRRSSLGPEHPAVAASLDDYAGLYHDWGDYPRAERLYQQAVELKERVLGAEHLSVATSLGRMARLQRDQGDYGSAARLQQRAMTIQAHTLGQRHPELASTIDDLAQLYMDQGEYPRAEELYRRAMSIREETFGGDHPDVATSLTNLARLSWKRGDAALAEPLLERALTIKIRALGSEHPSVPMSLRYLAQVYDRRGDGARAELTYRQALSLQEKLLGAWHPSAVPLLYDLSGMYLARGDVARALDAQARGAAVRDRHAALLLAAGSEAKKRAYMAMLARETSETISLHMKHAPADSNAARLALTTILRRKGSVLDAMADSLAALRGRLGPEDRRVLDELASVQSELSTLTLRGPGSAPIDRHRAALIALEQRRQALEADISRRSAEFRAQAPLVTIEDVLAALPNATALVEIVMYEPYDPRTATWGAPRYAAYVLRGDGGVLSTELGEASAIDASVKALRRALALPSLDPRPPARALDERLMEPIRALLGGARSVLVSADGALNLVPFGALVDERDAYLVESFTFTYLTSGRDLLRHRGPRPATGSGALVIADPDFGTAAAPSGERGESSGPSAANRRSADIGSVLFRPLHATVLEGRTVARTLGEARLLIGPDATEESLKAASRPHVLHLATHGFFLAGEARARAARAATNDGGLAQEGPATLGAVSVENPLLRSGIALAGANLRAGEGEDGVLTALEAAGLDLQGTRMVVLSACETGVGETSAGEGVYGLRRALVIAGAETLVMSLWKIDDEATRELMTAYYAELQADRGRSDAMRAVQLSMLASGRRSHPYYWASFIVAGNATSSLGEPDLPRPAVPPSAPWRCGCSAPGAAASSPGSWAILAFAFGLAGPAARRSWDRRRRGRRRVAAAAALAALLALAGCGPAITCTVTRTMSVLRPPSPAGQVTISSIRVPEEAAVQLGVVWAQSEERTPIEELMQKLVQSTAAMGGNFLKIDHMSTQFTVKTDDVTGFVRKDKENVQTEITQILGRVYWVSEAMP